MEDKPWKVVFFAEDKTYSVINCSVKQENKFKIISDKKCSAKFGASWYDGNILATAGKSNFMSIPNLNKTYLNDMDI
jgi:hypothetical protein